MDLFAHATAHLLDFSMSPVLLVLLECLALAGIKLRFLSILLYCRFPSRDICYG